MHEFITNLMSGHLTRHDLVILAAVLFGILWVLVRLEARKGRRKTEPTTVYVAPDHASPIHRAQYEKRRFKPAFRRVIEMSQMLAVLAAALALDYFLGGALYDSIDNHRYRFGDPETLFKTGFFCCGLWLTVFSLQEFFSLLRRRNPPAA